MEEKISAKVSMVLSVLVLIISATGLTSALLFMLGPVNWAQVLLVVTVVMGFLTTLVQQYLLHRKD